jgi:four helix bundle protein
MQWKKLKVWQETHKLVLEIYKLTASFPQSEIYGLVNQLKRAASSVPANIVEGQSRNTTKDYLHFLYNSRGSLEEVRYFLLLARDLGFLSADSYEVIEKGYESASKMLNGLIKSLRAKTINPQSKTLNP